MLLPLRSCEAPGAKGKLQPAPVVILRESIKWRAKDGDSVQMLHDTAAELLRIVGMLDQGSQQQQQQPAGSATATSDATPRSIQPAELSADVRVVFGNAIRRMKQFWRIGGLVGWVWTVCRAMGLFYLCTAGVCLPSYSLL